MYEFFDQVFHHGLWIALIPLVQFYFAVSDEAFQPIIAFVFWQGLLYRIVLLNRSIFSIAPNNIDIIIFFDILCFHALLPFSHVLFLELFGSTCGIGPPLPIVYRIYCFNVG